MQEIFVIKIGGETLENPNSLENCLQNIAHSGKKIILVHGGGKKATELAQTLGIKQQMIEGRRVTDKTTLDICTMVYAGLISKNIVAQLMAFDCPAIGLSGVDMGCVRTKKRAVNPIDYGYVGDVQNIQSGFFEHLLSIKSIPVICSITLGEAFELLNTNADTMASEIAKALAKNNKVNLVYCFEKNGVLTDINDENSVVTQMDTGMYEKMLEAKQIVEGMIPKMNTAFNALKSGVNEVKIINSLFLNDYFANRDTGTRIKLNL